MTTFRQVDLTVNVVSKDAINDKLNYISGSLGNHELRLRAAEAVTAASHTPNTVYAAPSGTTGPATFRALVAADIPALSTSKLTTGILTLARGGTGADLSGTGGANKIVKQKTAGGAFAVETIAASELSNGVTGSGKVVLQAAPTITGTITLDSGIKIVVGSGSPEAAVSAPVGSVYHRTDGGAGTSFYVKETGSGATGWIGK